MIDVSELMADPDFVSSLYRLRPTSTVAKEGEVTNTYTSSTIIGCVQDPCPVDVALLPEGVRLVDAKVVFTAADVSPGDSDQLPDLLQIKTESYRVLHVQDFRDNGYVRVLAQRYPAGDYIEPEEEDDAP